MQMKLSIGLGVLIIVLLVILVVRNFQPKSNDPFNAASSGDDITLREWLGSGGDPNLANSAGESLLYLGTGPQGNARVVRVLLEFGANPNLVPSGNDSPLMNAAMWADYDAVKALVEGGANIYYRSSDGKRAIDVVGNIGHESGNKVRDYLRSRMDTSMG